MRPVGRVDIAAEHALDMTSCVGKIPGLTQYGPDHSIGDQAIGRVRLFRGETAKSLRMRQRSPVFAAGHPVRPQPPKRPQLIFGIFQTVSDGKGAGPGLAALARGALCVKQRQAQCRLELHFVVQIPIRSRNDM